MDLRERVARAWDAGEDADTIADTYAVSRAWVHRLIQRRRATGSLAPRRQTVFRKQAFAGQEDRLRALVVAQPDQTLAELRAALQSRASLSSVWRALDRLGITIKKNRPRGRTAPAGRRR
jgi:putative transposase